MGSQLIEGLSPATGRGMRILVEQGLIAAVTACELPAHTPFVARGLVDLQINGYGGVDFNGAPVTPDAALRLCRQLAGLGVTRFLATVITGSAGGMLAAMTAIAAARRSHGLVAEMIAGIHAEGPSIAIEDGPRGAHPPDQVRAPDTAEFERWQQATGGLVRLVTLAPELAGAQAYIGYLAARGVIVSIGHSAASPDQIRSAVEAGAGMSTHLGNGVAASLPRHPNLIWAQLAEDRLVAALIADGHHLSPETFRAMVRSKGTQRVVLVSDTVALGGMAPGVYRQPVGDTVELTPDGRVVLSGTPYLAGAALPLSAGVVRAARMAGLSLAEALALASDNPARLLGLAELAPGAAADLIVFDAPAGDELAIRQTWIAGERVFA